MNALNVDTTADVWILPLDTPNATLETAGGKGFRLGGLLSIGLPVPPGFLLLTAAYRAFVAHNGLAPSIESTLENLDAQDPAALEIASVAIRGRFAAGKLPPELGRALGEAYRKLGAPPVAVRSSATAEDLPELSFAGQQDTFLNVLDEEALLKAVVGCWSSLWTARAIGYRARNGIAHEDLALAVVVQQMAAAEASGVLFTADPLSGRRTEMVLEATLGLGEALVSGQVEPDRFRIEAATGRVLERALGAKALSIRPQQGGGTVTKAEDGAGRQALPDEAIAKLAHLGRLVASFFDTPQDVEWAWDGERIWLLQSRPITSLFPVPEGLKPQPLQVLFSFGAAQGILGPMTPLGQDTVRAVFAGGGRVFGVKLAAETQAVVHSAAERLFVDITGLLRNRVGRRMGHAFLGVVAPGVQQALTGLLDDPRLGPAGRPSLRTVRRVARFMVPVLVGVARTLLRPEASRVRFHEEIEARLAEVEAGVAAETTLAGRVVLIEELLAGAFPWLLPRFGARLMAGMGTLSLLVRESRELSGGEAQALTLTRGLPHNVTTEMDLALWAAAQAIRSDPDALNHVRQGDPGVVAADLLDGRLPGVAQEALDGFLGRYGARGVGEIDIGRARWRENPVPVVQAVQSYLQIDDPGRAPDAVFARGAEAAQQALGQMVAQARATRGGRFKARRVRWAAGRVRALAGLRESPKFWVVRVMWLVRGALLDSGADLVKAGVLDRADDLFFFTLRELRVLAAGRQARGPAPTVMGAGQEGQACAEGQTRGPAPTVVERDWRGVVQQRRAVYAREERRTQVPRLLLSDGQAFYEGVVSPEGDGEGVLAGSPVSPGVVEGRVRVVLDPHGARLAPGEILVCPGTDPAWTPLFLAAGGLVMEVGGLMTHGSVVAREYGIPAVVGVTRACERLKTGQRVRVDGTTGRVTLLEGE